MSYFELEIDPNCLLTGEIIVQTITTSNSLEERVEYHISSFTIFVWIEGIEYDVTRAITDKSLEYFKDKFVEHYSHEIHL